MNTIKPATKSFSLNKSSSSPTDLNRRLLGLGLGLGLGLWLGLELGLLVVLCYTVIGPYFGEF
jgi:hypothetical protein